MNDVSHLVFTSEDAELMVEVSRQVGAAARALAFAVEDLRDYSFKITITAEGTIRPDSTDFPVEVRANIRWEPSATGNTIVDAANEALKRWCRDKEVERKKLVYRPEYK